jgi:hypothetical protein
VDQALGICATYGRFGEQDLAGILDHLSGRAPGELLRASERHTLQPGTGAYHAEAALRCPGSNSTSCSITLKVVGITSGGATVEQSRSITEARDGAWRLYTFDTTSFGRDHAKIRLTVLSDQTINVDGLFLKRSG